MKEFFRQVHNKSLEWLVMNKPLILYELSSAVKTFLSGVGLYLVTNYHTFQFEQSAMIGLVMAAARSGVKVLWAFLSPQLIALFTKWKK